MSSQSQKRRPARPERQGETPAPAKTKTAEERAADKAATDALLDEIDALLEESDLATESQARDFVADFVQKGGQ